jgi:hypothetical protein
MISFQKEDICLSGDRCKLKIFCLLVGRPFDEAQILQIAYMYEEHYNLSEQFIIPDVM